MSAFLSIVEKNLVNHGCHGYWKSAIAMATVFFLAILDITLLWCKSMHIQDFKKDLWYKKFLIC